MYYLPRFISTIRHQSFIYKSTCKIVVALFGNMQALKFKPNEKLLCLWLLLMYNVACEQREGRGSHALPSAALFSASSFSALPNALRPVQL